MYYKDNIDFSFVGGIAYKDEIICGECGGIVKVKECKFIRILPWRDQ